MTSRLVMSPPPLMALRRPQTPLHSRPPHTSLHYVRTVWKWKINVLTIHTNTPIKLTYTHRHTSHMNRKNIDTCSIPALLSHLAVISSCRPCVLTLLILSYWNYYYYIVLFVSSSCRAAGVWGKETTTGASHHKIQAPVCVRNDLQDAFRRYKDGCIYWGSCLLSI